MEKLCLLAMLLTFTMCFDKERGLYLPVFRCNLSIGSYELKTIPPVLWYGVLLLLAVGVTVLSSSFVRPLDCRGLCDPSDGTPCPAGLCAPGEQKAGLPMPFLVDSGVGSSPTNGWGILGPEDLPNPMIFLLDVLFFGLVFWLGYTLVRYGLGLERTLDRLAVGLALALVAAGVVGGILLYQV
jgi:hypothetical protein